MKMPKNPPFGGSIAAEALLRLSPDDRLKDGESSCSTSQVIHVWLVQYRDHTTQAGFFDSGIGCTTNWAHVREAWSRDWRVATYLLKNKDMEVRFKQVRDVCNEIPHGFGKWSALRRQNGEAYLLVGTSDNLLRALQLSPIFQSPVSSPEESMRATASPPTVTDRAIFDPVRDLSPDFN